MAEKKTELRYAPLIEQTIGNEIDWDDFRIFLEVIREGSFNKAATRLNMTQPTVSRRLLRLEKAVGTRLFERDRRGTRLTYEGQRVYNDASAAQAALTRAATYTTRSRAPLSGECKLLMSEALATYWVSRFVGPLLARHPDIEFRVFGTNTPTAEKREASDLHVHYYEPADSERGAIRLGMLHFMPFASRAYLDRYGAPHSVEDLENHRLLDQSVQLSDVSNWAQWARRGGQARTSYFTNLSGGLGEAVRYGAGIALMPTYAAAIDASLQPIEIGLRFQMPISMTIRRDAAQLRAVRTVFDFLRETVFDRASMPWFAADYIPPQPDWPALCETLIAQAGPAEHPAVPQPVEA